MTLGPGSALFEHYRLVREIGRGGMGVVWLGVQALAGVSRPVAIKTLSTDLALDARNVEQFMAEAQLITSLNHPNIVSVLHGGRWHEVHAIVMEYVDGETLSRLLRLQRLHGKVLPPRFVVETIRDVALALFHAHSASDHQGRPLKLVHRDVTPQNIMVRLDGVTKLLDFGIARAATHSSHTETGVVRGKIRYLAPEQLLGRQMDGRTDQFALGIILWELLTGTDFIEAKEIPAVLARLNNPHQPPPTSFHPNLPVELDRVVERMLTRTPNGRYANCREVAVALTQIAEALPHETSAAALVEHLCGETIRQRLRGHEQIITSAVSDEPKRTCASCGQLTARDDRFCPRCGRSLDAKPTTSVQKSAAVPLVLVDVELSAPAAVGPLLVARALQAIGNVARERSAQIIAVRSSGLTMMIGLPQASKDDAARGVALGERAVATVRLIDPSMQTSVLVSAGMGVVSGLSTEQLVVVGPVLETAERNRSALKSGSFLLDAIAARQLGKSSREIGAGLFELPKTQREVRPATTELREEGREIALSTVTDWVLGTTVHDRVKVWLHRRRDGASSLLHLVRARVAPSRARVRLLPLSGLDHARPYGLIRRLIDDALLGDANARVSVLVALGVEAGEAALAQKALELQPVERPDLMPQVLGAVLLKVLSARPSVLLIDDAHHADLASLRVINQIARSLPAPNAMLLVTAPHALEPLALVAYEQVPTVQLDDFRRIWEARSGKPLDPTAAAQIWSAAGEALGHGLLLTEQAVNQQVLKLVGDRYALVAPLDAQGETDTSLEQRLGSLTTEALRYLERAVVLGNFFSRTWVSAAVGLNNDEAVIDELVSAAFLTQEHRFFDDGLRARLLEVLPVAALRRARVELAYSTAEAFPGDSVAMLSEEARLFAEAEHPNAIRAGLLAASRLEAVGATLEALEALSRVLRRLRQSHSTEAKTVEVAASLMRIALQCSVERGLVEVKPLIETEFEAAAHAGLISWWAKGMLLSLKPDEAADVVHRALQVGALGAEAHARLLGSEASVCIAQGKPAEARQAVTRAFQLMNARPPKEPSFYWEHLNLLGRACVELGDVSAAEEAFQSALQQAERVGSFSGRARASTNLAGLSLRQGQADGALRWLEKAEGHAVRGLDRQELARVQLNRANVLLQLGQPAEARAEALLAEESAHLAGWVEGVGLTAALLGRLGA